MSTTWRLRMANLARRHIKSPPAGVLASKFVLLRLTNIVAGTNYNVPMDLPTMREIWPPIVVEKRFTGKICRLGYGTATATGLFFNGGAFNTMGARNIEIVHLFMHEVAKRFRQYGLDATIPHVSTDNIVAVGQIRGGQIALEKLHNNMVGFMTAYEPIEFPGLVCSFKDPSGCNVVFMIFRSGKVMCLGIADWNYVQKIYIALCMVAEPFIDDVNNLRGAESKSRASAVRKSNQQGAAANKSNNTSKKTIKIIKEAVMAFNDANESRRTDTAFAQNMQEEMAEVVRKALADAEAKAAARKGRKRKVVEEEVVPEFDPAEVVTDY